MKVNAFFKSFVMTTAVILGLLYYQTDGSFTFRTGNYELSSVDEVGALIHMELDTDVSERPDSIVFDYLTEDEELDFTTDDILYILYNGGYNVKSVENFNMQGQSRMIQKDRVIVNLDINYIDDADDEVYIQSEVDRILSEIITEDMTDYQKVEAINHFVTNHINYDHSDPQNGQSVRVALEHTTGVCTAYARLTGRMLDQVGIENIGISGDGNGDGGWIGHAWNKVQIDGEWYNLDTTWNHPRTVGGKHSEYQYFLVSDDFIQDTHVPYNKDNLPQASNKQFEKQYDNDFSDVVYNEAS